jgi:hypothetical protein
MEPEAAPVLLSLQQQARLDELEKRIDAGLSTFLSVSEALWKIKIEGLFRAHGSFEAYCQERWGFSSHHAARVLRSFHVARLLQENSDCPPLPENTPEKLLRPLCPLEPPLRVAIWRLANEVSGGAPESRVLNALTRAVKHAIDCGSGIKDKNGASSSSNSSDSHKPLATGTPSRSQEKNFFAILHQLASTRAGFSAYLAVRELDEQAARAHLNACQDLISVAHEVIESIRQKFPWI